MAQEVLVLQLAVTGVLLGGLYALVASGLNMIYGVARILNIAHGDVLMLGAYLAFFFFTLLGANPLLSAIVAAVAFGGAGGLIYTSLFSRIVGKGQSAIVESNSLLVTFGLIVILEGVASLAFTANQQAYQFLPQGIDFYGITIVLNRLFAFAVSSAIVFGLYVLVRWTWLGRAIRCVMDDPVAARLVGVNTDRIYLYITSLGFALAGVAGSMISMLFAITPFIGLGYTIIAFVVVVIGGAGSVHGAWVAGLVTGLAQTLGVHFTSPAMQVVISYLLLIVVLVVRPRGLFGTK